MRIKWHLAIASIKMFFRQREAIIWTLLLPLFMVALFSFVDFSGSEQLRVGVVDHSERLTRILGGLKSMSVETGPLESELKALASGDRDVVLEESAGADGNGPNVIAFVRESSSDAGEITLLAVRGALQGNTADSLDPASGRIDVRTVDGPDRSYIDFLLPGVMSMSIMQLGIFGVAFSLVSFKKRGILRRLSVTPVKPADFVMAQIAMRLLVVVMQIVLLSAVGVNVLDVHLSGNVLDMVVAGLLGALVFLGFGFAIAGVSKSEDQVAPLANIVAMPMILLSGIFFDRSHLPGLVRTVTEILPLTFLTDSMRDIAVRGAGIGDVVPQIAGLAAWCLVSTFVAVKLFRWE
jgi:ABC-2 type transport system permease protein